MTTGLYEMRSISVLEGRVTTYSQQVVDTMGDEYTLNAKQMIVRCMHAGKSFMFSVMYSIIQGAAQYPNGFLISNERALNRENPFPIKHGQYTQGKLERGCFIEFICPNNNTAVIIVTKTVNRTCPNYIRAFVWKAKEMAEKFNRWQQMRCVARRGMSASEKRKITHNNSRKRKGRLRL